MLPCDADYVGDVIDAAAAVARSIPSQLIGITLVVWIYLLILLRV